MHPAGESLGQRIQVMVAPSEAPSDVLPEEEDELIEDGEDSDVGYALQPCYCNGSAESWEHNESRRTADAGAARPIGAQARRTPDDVALQPRSRREYRPHQAPAFRVSGISSRQRAFARPARTYSTDGLAPQLQSSEDR